MKKKPAMKIHDAKMEILHVTQYCLQKCPKYPSLL
jgi:hypothetical protein